MITVRPFQPDHGMIIRPDLVDPWLTDDPMIFRQWMEVLELQRCCQTICLDGRPVVVLGICMRWQGFGEVLLLASKHGAGHVSVARAIKRVFWQMFRQNACRRVQATIRVDCTAGIKLAGWVGFRWESLLQGMFPDCDGVLMAVVERAGA
jgi:hypothetical protein